MSKKLKDEFIQALAKGSNTYMNNYFKSFEYNIFRGTMPDRFGRMYMNGDGFELVGKACAIHSSSMLAYNFFHWIDENHPLKIDHYEFSKVYFEVHLPVLKNRNNAMANMDVVLEGIDNDNNRTLLFIESKFTEHFENSKGEITKMTKNSYSTKCYYPYNNDYSNDYRRFNAWQQLIQYLAKKEKEDVGYYDGIKQEICHLIALTNLKNDPVALDVYKNYYEDDADFEIHPKITGDDETFLFYNILFDPKKEYEDADYYGNYEKLYNNDLMKELEDLKNKPVDLKNKPVDLTEGIKEMKIMSYREMYNYMVGTMDKNLKDYLDKRYMQFSK